MRHCTSDSSISPMAIRMCRLPVLILESGMVNAMTIGLHLRHSALGARAANLLSASRFVLGAMWLAAFVNGDRSPEVLGSGRSYPRLHTCLDRRLVCSICDRFYSD